jgi:hypothetical protein
VQFPAVDAIRIDAGLWPRISSQGIPAFDFPYAELIRSEFSLRHSFALTSADSDDLARVYRFDLAQDSEMISPTMPILMSPGA